ncbi:MAG: hypothetical protein SGBAC_004316 [Bacillariaceae sp.]
MEDRHYLSEPRPIAGRKLPTWEVDVMRDGVDMPILTLQVDNRVLPPRKRKKKVVWKLPDDLSNNPKFGTEDKRRILELFKQKKKELKRARKSQTTTTAATATATGSTTGNTGQTNANNSGQNSPSSSGSTNKPKLLQRMSSSGLSVADTGSYIANTNTFANTNANTAGNNEEQPEDDPGEEGEESKLQERPEIGRGEEKVDYTTTNRGASSSPQPPGFGIRASTSSIPPPGILAPGRYFLVANHDNNNNNNNNNNALGHVVMETYYMLLRQGMVQELASYYLPNAQKSLTVGGAHALCTRVDQRIQQLTSLANMVLTVKGVLQHPRIDDGNNNRDCCCSYFIMITGTSVRPQCLPFCHSLTLKQVGPQAFQIQNDALAFLTTEG